MKIIAMLLGATFPGLLLLACGGGASRGTAIACPPGDVCIEDDASAAAAPDAAQGRDGACPPGYLCTLDDSAASATSDARVDDGGGDGDLDDAAVGPTIVAISESPSSITQGGAFTVVATVTHPLGLADLAGGELTTASGAELGTFVLTTQGIFSVTVSWAQLTAAAATSFTSQATLTSRATFYDAQGRKVSQDVSAGLFCGSAATPSAACAGTCVDLSAADTCGSCTASCTSLGGASATNTTCASPGVCAWKTATVTTNPNDTCAAECAAGGGNCTSAQMTPDYGMSSLPETCATTPASIGDSIEVAATVTGVECRCEPTSGSGKTLIGNCATECESGPNASPCEATRVYVVKADGTTDYFDDTCSAPYAVGVGDAWDNIVKAALPQTVMVLSPATPIDCACSGTLP